MFAALLLMATVPSANPSFEARDDGFYLNGQPFVVHSGEMHYPRVPRDHWRDRFRMARAMGLNTICTYVFWNLHERTPGKFDFSGNLDLAAYIKTAQEEGLYVIVRPGPYICTELDFGGFPAWLLKDRSVRVRSRDAKYLAATKRYLERVGRIVKPLTIDRGGPVIMAQVENEYGSYGKDHEYMAWVRDTMRGAGFDCQLFTSDGPGKDMLEGGTLPDLPATINFGGGAEGAFKSLAAFRAKGPRMIGEYWAGWFDHWGKRHHRTNIANHAKDLEWCVKNGVSFNLYMFHGGTNFGFLQGANGGANDYNVDTTSYDYDAPLDESGRPTEKFWAFRKVLGGKLPVPEVAPTVALPRFTLSESASLFDRMPVPVKAATPMTFEELDQAHGLVLYRTRTATSGDSMLEIGRLGDYATVFVNGKRAGVLDRRRGQRAMPLVLPKGGAEIDILVEALSRVNFGGALPDERKGIDGRVTLGGEELKDWEHFRFPLEGVRGIRYRKSGGDGPRFYRARIQVDKPGDTFLDMRNWNKGFVWVNGRNLGRFWRIGPQQTLFVPGVWLKSGMNDVVVYDDGVQVADPTIVGLSVPVLDEVVTDTVAKHRKPGQTLNLEGRQPDGVFELPAGAEATTVALANRKGRYLCLEATDSHDGGAYTSLAEIWAYDSEGKEVAKKDWRVAYADSEEMDAENGSAANVFDMQPTTYWHTEWQADQPKHPHTIVIDLGREVSLSTLRLLPRQVGVNGRIRGLKVYLSPTPFAGL